MRFQTLSQKIFETVSDVHEIMRTRDDIMEMEKSITALSAAGEFQLATQSRKENKE